MTAPLLVLDVARLDVDPGGEAVLHVRVRNQATVVDELRLQVLGPAAEWATLEPTALSLFPGAEGQATVRIRPPRTWSTTAGPVPVGVRAASTVDPGRVAVEECTLAVGAFCEVAAELLPRTSRGRLRGRHEVRLTSAGNAPLTVALSVKETDGNCRAALDPRGLTLAPGQTASARLTVRPNRVVWFGTPDACAFEAQAAPDGAPEVKVAGAMQPKPVVSRGAAMLAAAVAIGAVAIALVGRGALGPDVRSGSSAASAVAGTPAANTTATPAPSAAPSPTPSPSPSPSASASAAGPSPTARPAGGTPTPVVAATVDTLPWPATEDCIPHNPATLTVVYNSGAAVWQVLDGSHALLAFKTQTDANDGMAVAKRFDRECFIGRGNTRTNRSSYITEYWRDPSGLSATIASPDCIPYNRSNLSIVNLGTTGWQLRDGNNLIALYDTQTDAQAAVTVMQHWSNICYVGRDYSGSDRLQYITTYFT
ncbi:MAG TPA: hypothetical protein VOB72_12790 [Candidatus Dormibacteraeota bacterium]|nr:hypothetical protein [Candidatus Dormibacteraeota bacterium]